MCLDPTRGGWSGRSLGCRQGSPQSITKGVLLGGYLCGESLPVNVESGNRRQRLTDTRTERTNVTLGIGRLRLPRVFDLCIAIGVLGVFRVSIHCIVCDSSLGLRQAKCDSDISVF